MLKSLHIANYALIDTVDIEFAPGFNAITGETGAGKSIMLGALSLILGARADTKAIRRSDRKTVVEAIFEDVDSPAVKSLLERNEIETDPDAGSTTVILRREITPGGRSRAFVCDTPVGLGVMQQIATHLVDIHSQHQNLLIADPAFQLEIIDRIADNRRLLSDYRTAVRQLQGALKELRTAKERLNSAMAEKDRLTELAGRLNALALEKGETARLEQEREILTNAAELKTRCREAIETLSGENSGSLATLRSALHEIGMLASAIPADDPVDKRLESVVVEVNDIVGSLQAIDDRIQPDEQLLARIEERLDEIYDLQKRNRLDDPDRLVDLQADVNGRLAMMAEGANSLGELRAKATRLKADAMALAQQLSERRREAATRFAAELAETARPLGMDNLVVDIRMTQGELSASGIDTVDFLFAFNKNQEPLSVARTASGGEMSRLMLSVKTLVAKRMSLPTIIFDEIDTGVSGRVAASMGRMMRQIAESTQVVAITHLPQVAAMAPVHYKVYKEDDSDATHTRISRLNPDQRIDEIALLIAGSDSLEAARSTAQSLLNSQTQDGKD